MKEKNENYQEPIPDDVIEVSDCDEFEIGQSYDIEPAKKLICKKCKNDKFFVGCGDHYTAIKCPICKYELMIHEG